MIDAGIRKMKCEETLQKMLEPVRKRKQRGCYGSEVEPVNYGRPPTGNYYCTIPIKTRISAFCGAMGESVDETYY